MGTFCRECGNQLKDGAAFCNVCGTAVGAASGDSAPPAEMGSPEWQTAVTTPIPPSPAAAPTQPFAPVAAPTRRSHAWVWWSVAAVVLALLIAGGVAAWQMGWLDGMLGEKTAEASSGGKSKDKSAEGKSDEGDTASEDGDVGVGGGGKGSGDSGTGGASPGTDGVMTPEVSYDLLSQHYVTLWEIHASIGLQDAGSYTGTGFVFEAGGFNESIGAKDLAVREALVDRCKTYVDQVTTSRDALQSANVDAAYAVDKQNLLTLYGYLFNRVDALYQAAVVAVDNPDRDSGWGPVLQPRSKDNREAFEASYDTMVPVQR